MKNNQFSLLHLLFSEQNQLIMCTKLSHNFAMFLAEHKYFLILSALSVGFKEFFLLSPLLFTNLFLFLFLMIFFETISFTTKLHSVYNDLFSSNTLNHLCQSINEIILHHWFFVSIIRHFAKIWVHGNFWMVSGL